jgi:hypothetical protein
MHAHIWDLKKHVDNMGLPALGGEPCFQSEGDDD